MPTDYDSADEGECRECGEPTTNFVDDADEDGPCGSWLPCNACTPNACTHCGEIDPTGGDPGNGWACSDCFLAQLDDANEATMMALGEHNEAR